MKIILMLIGLATCPVSFAAASVNVKCTAKVTGQSGHGQTFSFSDVLTAAFRSPQKGELQFQANGDLEDIGLIVLRGPSKAHENYSYYSGKDKLNSGTVALSLPNGILMKPAGTRFKGYFDTFENDLGTTRPIKILDDLEMNCLIQ